MDIALAILQDCLYNIFIFLRSLMWSVYYEAYFKRSLIYRAVRDHGH
jgi:hypothetical protein